MERERSRSRDRANWEPRDDPRDIGRGDIDPNIPETVGSIYVTNLSFKVCIKIYKDIYTGVSKVSCFSIYFAI